MPRLSKWQRALSPAGENLSHDEEKRLIDLSWYPLLFNGTTEWIPARVGISNKAMIRSMKQATKYIAMSSKIKMLTTDNYLSWPPSVCELRRVNLTNDISYLKWWGCLVSVNSFYMNYAKLLFFNYECIFLVFDQEQVPSTLVHKDKSSDEAGQQSAVPLTQSICTVFFLYRQH